MARSQGGSEARPSSSMAWHAPCDPGNVRATSWTGTAPDDSSCPAKLRDEEHQSRHKGGFGRYRPATDRDPGAAEWGGIAGTFEPQVIHRDVGRIQSDLIREHGQLRKEMRGRNRWLGRWTDRIAVALEIWFFKIDGFMTHTGCFPVEFGGGPKSRSEKRSYRVLRLAEMHGAIDGKFTWTRLNLRGQVANRSYRRQRLAQIRFRRGEAFGSLAFLLICQRCVCCRFALRGSACLQQIRPRTNGRCS